MIVLGLDTSTSIAGIGLVSSNGTLAELNINLETAHSERLLSNIDYLLNLSDLSLGDLTGLSISIGPGSFTGLRIGLATVKGLAYASNKPIVAVSTLDAIAEQFWCAWCPVAAVLDAKKGQLYVAVYQARRDGMKRIMPYSVLAPEELPGIVNVKTLFVGPGISTFKKEISKALKEKALFLPQDFCYIRGDSVARIGMEKLADGEVEDADELEPFYVRDSDAQPRDFKRTRRSAC